MKVIIAGSRGIEDYPEVCKAVEESGFEITEVVSGGARGADFLGELWAKANGVPKKLFPADWTLGRAAGPIRNRQMAEYGEALIALHDGESPGTLNMIDEANARHLKVHVHTVIQKPIQEPESY